MIKNGETIARIIYSLLFWLSNYQDDPSRFVHIMDWDFDDDVKKHLIKVPQLGKEASMKAYQLLNKLKQTVPSKVFDNVEARLTPQERHQREIILKMYQSQ